MSTSSCFKLLLTTGALVLITGCSLQRDYTSSKRDNPELWSANGIQDPASVASATDWWKILRDPAIDELVEAAYSNNPTLDKAIARIDEARAEMRINRADYYPGISANVNVNKANTKINSGGGAGASSSGAIVGNSVSTTLGPSLSWELDLFGRIRSSVDASELRLDARNADAQSVRLSLASQVATGVIDWRACNYSTKIHEEEIESRQKTVDLLTIKSSAGFARKADVASVERDLAAAQGALSSQQEVCKRTANALVEMSGLEQAAVSAILDQPLRQDQAGEQNAAFMPKPPPSSPELPASVLLYHPSVIAADRNAAAAWADTGVARAERLPKVSLSAALSLEWIRAAGSTLGLSTWSLGSGLLGTVFDGGKGAANVERYRARYRQAVADLQSTVLSTVKEVENALAAEQSAAERIESSRRSETAAKVALDAKQAQWEMGMSSLLELEDARRQYANAQNDVITAEHDRAAAWIALVNATANSINLKQSNPNEPNSL